MRFSGKVEVSTSAAYGMVAVSEVCQNPLDRQILAQRARRFVDLSVELLRTSYFDLDLHLRPLPELSGNAFLDNDMLC